MEAGKKGITYIFIGGKVERDNLLEPGRKGITYGRQEGRDRVGGGWIILRRQGRKG